MTNTTYAKIGPEVGCITANHSRRMYLLIMQIIMENMSLEDIKKTAEAIFDDIQEDNKEPRNQTNVMLRLEKMLERPGEYSFKEFVNICHQMKEVLERLQNLKCEDISNLDLKNIVRTVDENSIDAIYYREMAVSSLRVLYKKVVTNER